MKLSDAIKKRLTELMEQNSIATIHQLALLAGIPYPSLNDFFKDRIDLPRLDKIVHICEALHIDLIEFFNSPFFKDIECDD